MNTTGILGMLNELIPDSMDDTVMENPGLSMTKDEDSVFIHDHETG